jgi:hypothetical protein
MPPEQFLHLALNHSWDARLWVEVLRGGFFRRDFFFDLRRLDAAVLETGMDTPQQDVSSAFGRSTGASSSRSKSALRSLPRITGRHTLRKTSNLQLGHRTRSSGIASLDWYILCGCWELRRKFRFRHVKTTTCIFHSGGDGCCSRRAGDRGDPGMGTIQRCSTKR